MANTLPFQEQCCVTCDDTLTANIPGAAGAAGSDGADGADGVNAYTTTTAVFAMPAFAATVTVDVADSTWITIGQILYIQGAGYMLVTAKPTSTSVTVRNLETAGGDYASNSAPATLIAYGSWVSPGGLQGPGGAAAAVGTPTLTVRTINVPGADTVLDTDDMIFVEAAGAVTLAMLTAVGYDGDYFIIKRSSAMAFGVTINANMGETIDGNAGITLMQPGESVTLISNGTGWLII